MAKVSCVIAASPAAVFAVLSEGWYYSDWVVGTSHVRAVDQGWPQQGSRRRAAASWNSSRPSSRSGRGLAGCSKRWRRMRTGRLKRWPTLAAS